MKIQHSLNKYNYFFKERNLAGTYVYNILRLFYLPIQGKERIWKCSWQTTREQCIFFFQFGWKLFFLPHIFRVTDIPWKGLLEGILFLSARISWTHDNGSHISGDLEWYIFSIIECWQIIRFILISMWLVTAAMISKDAWSLEEKLWQTQRAYIKADITWPTKLHIVKATVFPVGHVQKWELEHKEGWAQ